MIKPPKPAIKAMLICDRVITEAGSNKKSLIGIFENINAMKFPCVHHFLAVFIKLTDALGKYKFRLELIDLETDKGIGKAEIPNEIEVRSPLQIHDLVFNLASVKFPHPGKYEFRIYSNSEICGQKTFVVNEIKKPKPKEQ